MCERGRVEGGRKHGGSVRKEEEDYMYMYTCRTNMHSHLSPVHSSWQRRLAIWLRENTTTLRRAL